MYYGAWITAPNIDDAGNPSLLLGIGREAYEFYAVTPADLDGINGFRGELDGTLKLLDSNDIPLMLPNQIRGILSIANYFRDA